MNEKQEIIAKALEIAIALTGADYKWLEEDNGNIVMRDPLYSTVKRVMQVLNDDSFIEAGGKQRVFRGIAILPADKSQL